MKVFDAGKTIMIGLPYGEKNSDKVLSRFHVIPERYGQTDGQINIARQCAARDKNDSVTQTTPLSGRNFYPWGGNCRSRSSCQI